MTITIGTLCFDNVEYDADADVLYLSVGEPRTGRVLRHAGGPQHSLRGDGRGHRHHDRERQVAA